MDASEDAQTQVKLMQRTSNHTPLNASGESQALRQKLEQATKDVADTERQIQKTREMLERMEAQIPLYQNQAKVCSGLLVSGSDQLLQDAEGEVPSYTEDLRAMLSVSSVDFKETIKAGWSRGCVVSSLADGRSSGINTT